MLLRVAKLFTLKAREDKSCFLPEPKEGGELPKEVAESENSYQG